MNGGVSALKSNHACTTPMRPKGMKSMLQELLIGSHLRLIWCAHGHLDIKFEGRLCAFGNTKGPRANAVLISSQPACNKACMHISSKERRNARGITGVTRQHTFKSLQSTASSCNITIPEEVTLVTCRALTDRGRRNYGIHPFIVVEFPR